MISWLLKLFGYYKIAYGVACDRHWMSIDGKVIAQSPGDDLWLKDEDIHALGYVTVDHGKHWQKPIALVERDLERVRWSRVCVNCGTTYKWHALCWMPVSLGPNELDWVTAKLAVGLTDASLGESVRIVSSGPTRVRGAAFFACPIYEDDVTSEGREVRVHRGFSKTESFKETLN